MFFRKKKVRDGISPLSFFNTLSGKLEVFEALKSPTVTMYSCGITAYDHAHIGNMRPYVHADLVKRVLSENEYKVKHTINITDFGHLVGDGDEGEDKMMVALRRENRPITLESMKEMTEFYAESFKNDLTAMNNLPNVTFTPASEYIKKEIALVATLVEKGYTYETSDGVYFDISKFPSYGKLGNINVEKLKSGARVEVNPEKKHPADFAIWKKGSLGWESPWGKGFPGWHIECTAMAFATLGKQIDIHTGGIDLMATHHNGEIAQAETATKKAPYVRYWMHNAFITIDNTKISKSIGNTIKLSQLIERGYSPLDLRYWFLTGHYRSPMNFTFDALDGARQALYRLKRHIFEEYKAAKGGEIVDSYYKKFMSAVNNDLNTAEAVGIMWQLIDDKAVPEKDKVATVRAFDTMLGLGLSGSREEAARSLGVFALEDVPQDVRKLIDEREAARVERNWERADELRKEINLQGFLVEDTADGPRITKSV